MKYSELLFESDGWRRWYYHGGSNRLPLGICTRKFLFLSEDEQDSKQYGRNVYACEILWEYVADLTRDNTKAFRNVMLQFNHKPGIREFIRSHNMWDRNKRLEMEIFQYLFSVGYQVIEFRDTDHDDNEIFNIVALGHNVKIVKQVAGDEIFSEDLGKTMSLPSAIPINSTPVLPTQVKQ